ncbi:MAG: divergent polysaccharide deacetylase family protein [Candidatus Edwardsbacteria bacterium]|jgi:polysaccharide deacetylase 2 family uncharacterized protein YibQ|nr:divergent polysaccharide deacetylase family protein [Candidatus Edwardsbacteria bacterium]
MSRRTKKNRPLRLAVAVFVAVLLSLLAYRAVLRWKPGIVRPPQGATPRQSAQRFCRSVAADRDGYLVKSGTADSLFAMTLTDTRNRPFALTNLMLARRARACGIELLSAAEDRRRDRLELAYGVAGRPLVSVSVRRSGRESAGGPGDSRPRIALVAYGLAAADKAARSELAKLPEIRTLVIDRATAAAGRELLVSLPLEPIGYPKQDPGPGTILLDDSDSKVAAKLAKRFRIADRPAGFAVEAGSRALKDERITGRVARFCRENGLVLFEPRFTANSLAREQAAANGCPYLTTTAYLEPKVSAAAAAGRIRAALRPSGAGMTTVLLLPVRSDVLRELARALTGEVRSACDFVGVSGLGTK